MGAKQKNLRYTQGFTIIEVVLFMAITGLMATMLLGGWSSMINTQRYKDSVKSLQSFVQQQYNLVYNVENGRGGDLSCIDGNVDDAGADIPRGQTDCELLGRYIELSDGRTLKVSAIVGKSLGNKEFINDNEAIIESAPSRVDEDISLTESQTDIPWQAEAVGIGESTDRLNLAIAIIRSPQSGNVHTYVAPINTEVGDMISVDYERNETMMCLDAGAPFSGGRMGVRLKPFASSQSFVTVISDGEGVC